jgi:predicted GIY-YIG superfamily endonuclease
MHEIMKQLISEAVTFAESLLAEEPQKPNNIEYPTDSGVYFIRCDEKPKRGIIYVGKTSNLKHRIKDHLSAGTRDNGATAFRKKVKKYKKLEYIETTKDWIETNCQFAFIKIDDMDMCLLVESLLIAFLRKRGEPLLNS